jgi:hypothetical protein
MSRGFTSDCGSFAKDGRFWRSFSWHSIEEDTSMRARASRSRICATPKRHVSTQRKRRLGAERLEDRQLLAGDVSASVVRGTLNITGDNADNFVEVTTSLASRMALSPAI